MDFYDVQKYDESDKQTNKKLFISVIGTRIRFSHYIYVSNFLQQILFVNRKINMFFAMCNLRM